MAKVVTPTFRVSFPNVFKPKRNELNGKDEYSLVAVFKKGEDLSAIEKAIQDAAEKKWGADKKKWPPKMKTPLKSCDDRMKDGVLPAPYEKGAFYLNLKSTERPGLVDQKLQPILDSSEFYPGVYARATINTFAYDQMANKGVSVGLNNLQKVADGEALNGRVKAEADFSAVETENLFE